MVSVLPCAAAPCDADGPGGMGRFGCSSAWVAPRGRGLTHVLIRGQAMLVLHIGSGAVLVRDCVGGKLQDKKAAKTNEPAVWYLDADAGTVKGSESWVGERVRERAWASARTQSGGGGGCRCRCRCRCRSGSEGCPGKAEVWSEDPAQIYRWRELELDVDCVTKPDCNNGDGSGAKHRGGCMLAGRRAGQPTHGRRNKSALPGSCTPALLNHYGT